MFNSTEGKTDGYYFRIAWRPKGETKPQWTGPYKIEAKDDQEASDIMFYLTMKLQRSPGRFFEGRFLHVERHPNITKEGYFTEFYARERQKDVEDAIEQVMFERQLKKKYPNGAPRYRSIDED